MRGTDSGDSAIAGRAFERIAWAGLFGLVCGASACSGGSNDDCTASHTCTPAGRSLTTDSNDASPAAGGSKHASGGQTTANGGAPGAGGTAKASAPDGDDAAAGASAASPSSDARGNDASSVVTPDGGASDSDGGLGDAGAGDGGREGTTPVSTHSPVPCTAGWADCNGVPADGCEVDVSSNTTHCGACGRPCSTAGTVSAACDQGECKPTCDAEHADCDGNPVNGCETDIATNRNSCGACGHDCRGGACVAGECQPIAVSKGLSLPMFLTMLGDASYVVDFSSTLSNVQLVRIDASGTANRLFTFVGTPPAAVASRGKYVYWAVPSIAVPADPPNGRIDRLDLSDDSVHGLKSGIDPISVAVDDTNFYWGDAANQGVYQQSISAGTSIQLGPLAAGTLVSDGTTVFGASHDGNEIFSVSVGGGDWNPRSSVLNESRETLTVATHHVALDAQHVYVWYSDSTGVLQLWQTFKPAFRSRHQVASSTADSGKGPMVSDGNYVYFRKDDGLYRVSTTTKAPATLIANAVGQIFDLAIANGALYWLDIGKGTADGSLNQLAL